jgi:S1-C subfamily serine protease
MMVGKNKRNRKFTFLTLGLLFPVLALACNAVIPSSAVVVTEAPPQITEIVAPENIVASEDDVELESPPVSLPLDTGEEKNSLVEIYAQTNPSVVNVTIYSDQGGLVFPVGQGSGFVFDDQGHIVTNAHVVHGAEQVEITFADGSIRSAEVIGEDLNSDLAVVKVSLPDGIEPLVLGEMSELAVGQTVVAIGNPFGLEGTLTEGVISALGRSIPALTPFSIPQSIQTDAAINPGNSGGPLLNMAGEVIGVNAQIETDGESRSNLGVGFAIPVSIVKLVVPDLIRDGAHDWAWLGVRGGDVTPPLVEAMGLPVEKGAYFAEIVSGGPAANARLQGANESRTVNGRQVEIGGDIVTAINGQPVNSFDDLLIYIALQVAPDQPVTLTIVRGGQIQDVTVTLEDRPSSLDN